MVPDPEVYLSKWILGKFTILLENGDYNNEVLSEGGDYSNESHEFIREGYWKDEDETRSVRISAYSLPTFDVRREGNDSRAELNDVELIYADQGVSEFVETFQGMIPIKNDFTVFANVLYNPWLVKFDRALRFQVNNQYQKNRAYITGGPRSTFDEDSNRWMGAWTITIRV